jgi:hypothetical protein
MEVSSALETVCTLRKPLERFAEFFAFSITWKKKLARGEGEERPRRESSEKQETINLRNDDYIKVRHTTKIQRS